MKTNFDYLPDNVSLNLENSGLTVRVSLNIPKDLVPYMHQNNIKYSKKGIYVYALKQEIPTNFITLGNIELIHKKLLTQAMANIRAAKSIQYDHQAKLLYMKNYQIKLEF